MNIDIPDDNLVGPHPQICEARLGPPWHSRRPAAHNISAHIIINTLYLRNCESARDDLSTKSWADAEIVLPSLSDRSKIS